MRYSKVLNTFRRVIIRVDSFVVVTLRNDSYAIVCLGMSIDRYSSLSFVLKFRLKLATIRNYSLHFVQVRELSQIFVVGSYSIAWYAN